jgi:Flp pilus assembly protein TadD
MRHAVLLVLTPLLAGALVAGGPLRARSEAAPGQPATRGLYLQLIQQARTDGRTRAALAYLDDYEKTYSADVEARVLRTNCLLDLRQIDDAQAALAQLRPADHSGRFAAEVNAVHGHVLAARERWADAVPFYAAAVAADPTSAWLRNALGYSLLRARQPDRAVEALRDARDLAPEDTIIRNNLWLAYELSGRGELLTHALGTLPDSDAGALLRRQIEAEAARLRRLAAGPVATPSLAAAGPARSDLTVAGKAY